MKTLSTHVAACALLLLFFSCSSGDDGDPLVGTTISISDIQGNWNAIRAIFDIAGTGTSQSIDVVEEGGSVTLQIQSNGRFTLTITPQGESAEVSKGQMSFDEDLLVVEFDDSPGDSEYYGIQSSTSTLSISGPAEYDLDGDGTDDDAYVELDFVRA